MRQQHMNAPSALRLCDCNRQLTVPALATQAGAASMKILIKSAWGSDDPTKAAFAFLHANAFAEAGHEVRVFLLGEAVNLMKDEMIASVTPVGWPPLSEIIPKTIAHRIPLNI